MRKSLFPIVAALAAGFVLPVQGRVNSALSTEIGDPMVAALFSFLGGLILMSLIVLCLPRGRRAAGRVTPALRRGEVKWWYLGVGTVGAYLAFTQTLTISVLGVAVFTVAVLGGQLLGNVLLDRAGLSPAGYKPLTPVKGFGVALTLVAVAVVSAPGYLHAQPASGPGDRTIDPLWLVFAGLVLLGGLANAAQQTVNARQAAAYRSVVPGTLINYLAGTALLGLACLVMLPAVGTEPWQRLPPVFGTGWWYYLGGPLGCVFIAFGALLISRSGALTAGIGITAGNVLGSLAVDVLVPTPEAPVTLWTYVGVGLALVAALLVTVSGGVRRAGAELRRKPPGSYATRRNV